MFGLKIKQMWAIFSHLKLWVAVARHNFKWVEIQIILFSVLTVNLSPLGDAYIICAQ